MGPVPPTFGVLCASSDLTEPIELTLREDAHLGQARDDLRATIGKVARKGLQRGDGVATIQECLGRMRPPSKPRCLMRPSNLPRYATESGGVPMPRAAMARCMRPVSTQSRCAHRPLTSQAENGGRNTSTRTSNPSRKALAIASRQLRHRRSGWGGSREASTKPRARYLPPATGGAPRHRRSLPCRAFFPTYDRLH